MSETRTYRGGSLEELLPRIRAELGDDAVVVRQREGLTGGVAGFFQKRTVEIEARRGQEAAGVEWFAGDPEEEAIVTPSPRFTTVSDEDDARDPVAVTPQEEQAAREFAAVTVAASSPAVPPPPVEPAPRHSPFAAYLSAAGAPERAPSPASNGVPEAVPSARAGDVFPNAEELMRDALATPPAGEAIVTSPQVDAIPVPDPPRPEPEPVAPEPIPIRRPAPQPVHEPPPAAATWDPPTAPAPSPVVAQVAVGRPQVARHLITTLTSRGLDAALAAAIVDDAILHRLPLDPTSSLPGAVGAQLAARIPVATLTGPAARTLVLAGAAGSGAPRLVAGIAAAYASRTTVEVACVALRTPDGGRALAAALAPLGVPVHAAADGAQAAAQIALLGRDALVLVDTPPVTPEDAGRLASDLGALGRHELHLALGPGGGPSAPGLMQILRPHRLAIGDPSDPLHLGAVLQAAIDSSCPITYVASTAAAGRPDLAVQPADAGGLARALTA
jgi:hypothetical protein